MDRKINTPDREIRSLEKAAECPVGFFALLSKLFNPLDVGFKFHISESRPARLNRLQWSAAELAVRVEALVSLLSYQFVA